ncbi:hypothetical protein BDR03DRAFT_959694 [Suillus americanus]|nr:hypothetical protein BDR03DRAFT_959694 [Suillus americanus]
MMLKHCRTNSCVLRRNKTYARRDKFPNVAVSQFCQWMFAGRVVVLRLPNVSRYRRDFGNTITTLHLDMRKNAVTY